MSKCEVVKDGKPAVWKDDHGWLAERYVTCRTCGDCWPKPLAEDVTWDEAMQAALEDA